MAWRPDPNEPSAMFEGPVLQNCLTILARDFKEALDWYYLDTPTYTTRYGQANEVGPTGEDLLDFQERALGPALQNIFPCLGVEPRINDTEDAEDNSHELEAIRVQLNLAVTADGPDAVTVLIMKYVRVVHLVLQNARWELVTGMSNPFGVVLVDFVHVYDLAREQNSIISRAAAIQMSVGLRER